MCIYYTKFNIIHIVHSIKKRQLNTNYNYAMHVRVWSINILFNLLLYYWSCVPDINRVSILFVHCIESGNNTTLCIHTFYYTPILRTHTSWLYCNLAIKQASLPFSVILPLNDVITPYQRVSIPSPSSGCTLSMAWCTGTGWAPSITLSL